jgi:hypothetical protein
VFRGDCDTPAGSQAVYVRDPLRDGREKQLVAPRMLRSSFPLWDADPPGQPAARQARRPLTISDRAS